MDYRFCKRGLFGAARAFTICGACDYLSPEQISQIGHSYPVDLWGMGVLLYELVVGAHPFSSTSEVATYCKISSFGTKAFPTLKLPEGIPNDTKSLINQLLVPTPEARIGTGMSGFHALKQHAFFASIADWDALHNKSEDSPLRKFAHAERLELVMDGMEDKLLESFVQPSTQGNQEKELAWLNSLHL
jgi:serine/threonine protein kinase